MGSKPRFRFGQRRPKSAQVFRQSKATISYFSFYIQNVTVVCLKQAGISENHLKDKATRDFIYDFIDKNGGKEAAIREISTANLFSAPPVPARNPPSTPQTARMAPPAPPAAAPPPPPPTRVNAPHPSSAPPAPPQR